MLSFSKPAASDVPRQFRGPTLKRPLMEVLATEGNTSVHSPLHNNLSLPALGKNSSAKRDLKHSQSGVTLLHWLPADGALSEPCNRCPIPTLPSCCDGEEQDDNFVP